MKISTQYFELRHLHTKKNFPQNWFITIDFEAFQHHISLSDWNKSYTFSCPAILAMFIKWPSWKDTIRSNDHICYLNIPFWHLILFWFRILRLLSKTWDSQSPGVRRWPLTTADTSLQQEILISFNLTSSSLLIIQHRHKIILLDPWWFNCIHHNWKTSVIVVEGSKSFVACFAMPFFTRNV